MIKLFTLCFAYCDKQKIFHQNSFVILIRSHLFSHAILCVFGPFIHKSYFKITWIYQVSFYILPFSYFKEAKYNFFTFLQRKPGILLILPNTSTIKTLCPSVSSASVFSEIPTSNLSAPGVTIPEAVTVPQKGPYELLYLLVQEEVGTSLPNAAMAQIRTDPLQSPLSLL